MTRKRNNNNKLRQNKPNQNPRSRGYQGKKDSDDKRINLDNARADKLIKAIEKDNDPSWYSLNPELLKSAASLPFAKVIGSYPTFESPVADPGVLALDFWPSVGGSNAEPLNTSANLMYSYTVHANSRNTKYNAPDQMVLVIAAANIYACLANGIRAYGVAKQYDAMNMYMPEGLLYAMGFDADDIRKNLSKMWFDLNNLIAQMQQIWVPVDMPLFKRWWWLNTNVYTDADSLKSQFFIFVQNGYYQYAENSDSPNGASALIMKRWKRAAYNTWDQYLSLIQGMIDALVQSEDRGIIFGDILKAYGESNLMKLNPIDSEYKVIPTYSQEVLSQIENATIYAGCRPNQVTHDPAQDSQPLVESWTPTADDPAITNVILPGKQILNFHHDVVSSDDIMVATRLKAAGVTYDGSHFKPAIYGTEICTGMTMYNRNVMVKPFHGIVSQTYGQNVISTDGNYWQFSGLNSQDRAFNATLSCDDLGAYNDFDWAPFIYLFDTTKGSVAEWWNGGKVTPGNNLNITPFRGFGDKQQWTILDGDNLRQLHTVAMYSLFGVPKIGM